MLDLAYSGKDGIYIRISVQIAVVKSDVAVILRILLGVWSNSH